MAEVVSSQKRTSIFNTRTNPNGTYRSRITSSPLDSAMMSQNEEKLFNSYRYWNPFFPPMEGIVESTEENGKPKVSNVYGKHIKSLFSNTNAIPVYESFRVDANMPLLDNPVSRKKQRKNMACTIKDLVNASASGEMGKQIYTYADFAYCKYLGKISNNYLITLRRFPQPCGDKIDRRPSIRELEDSFDKHPSDIGRLVTWLGTPNNDISNILKYNYKVRWKTNKAEIEDVKDTGRENGGILNSIFNLSNANYRQRVMQGRAGSSFAGSTIMKRMLGSGGDYADFNPPYSPSEFESMYDKNKVYGPIDVIDSSTIRDRGLDFEQKISLTFDYELRSYYGVNGKAAMLDLLGNILAVTYTHGKFWGGAYRYVGGSQDNVFANLPIFKLAEKGQLNNPGKVYDALVDSINQSAKAFTGGMKGNTIKEKIVNFAKDLGGMLLGGLLNKVGRPQKFALNSLVNGAPTGCWHLTIGNPKSPIMEIGNLICTGAEVEHYGPLGLDDFPTGLRVKIELEHGKPRDISGIEKMYNRGDTRIYTPMGSKVMAMYNSSKKIGGGQDTISSSNSYKSFTSSNTAKKAKNEDTQETMNSPLMTGTATSFTDHFNIFSDPNDDIVSLKRYFGTEESSLITTASAEAFQGVEPASKNESNPGKNK